MHWVIARTNTRSKKSSSGLTRSPSRNDGLRRVLCTDSSTGSSIRIEVISTRWSTGKRLAPTIGLIRRLPIRKLVTVAPPLSRLHLVPALLSAALLCALFAFPAAGKQPDKTPPGQAKKAAARRAPPGQAKKSAPAPNGVAAKAAPGQAKKAAKAADRPARRGRPRRRQPPGQAKKQAPAAAGPPPGQATNAAGGSGKRAAARARRAARARAAARRRAAATARRRTVARRRGPPPRGRLAASRQARRRPPP